MQPACPNGALKDNKTIHAKKVQSDWTLRNISKKLVAMISTNCLFKSHLGRSAEASAGFAEDTDTTISGSGAVCDKMPKTKWCLTENVLFPDTFFKTMLKGNNCADSFMFQQPDFFLF